MPGEGAFAIIRTKHMKKCRTDQAERKRNEADGGSAHGRNGKGKNVPRLRALPQDVRLRPFFGARILRHGYAPAHCPGGPAPVGGTLHRGDGRERDRGGLFSGCTLKCAYCQNRVLSHDNFGAEVDTGRLSGIFAELEAQGVHSLDLVTGTMFIPSILDALDLRRPGVPVVWNTSGYERAETLKTLEGYVQVYLPDMKHVSSRLSSLCAGAEDYFRRASAALLEMRRQVGENVYDENGLLKRGMVIRHLVLPGCTADAREVLRFLASELKGVPVSIMSQYTPIPECRIPGLDRRVTDREYRRVLDWAEELGITGYSQERTSAEREYTPEFDLRGVKAMR